MTGLMRVEGGSVALPFVQQQGEGLMPLLFAVGQQSALEEASAQLLPGEHLAFHDDIHMLTMPERVGAVYAIVRMRARIRIHGGTMKVWNHGRERPAICDVLERIVDSRIHKPWCGEGPTFQAINKE